MIQVQGLCRQAPKIEWKTLAAKEIRVTYFQDHKSKMSC